MNALHLKSRTIRGALNLVLSTFFFGIAAALIKLLTTDYSIFEIAFFRNCFGLVPAFFISRRLGVSGFKSSRPFSHLARGFYGILSMFLIFHAYSLIPLPDATAISFAAPLFMTAFSVPLLHEKVGRHRWTAVLVGLIGVLIVLKPGSGMLTIGGISALASALFYALAMISLRKLRSTENAEVTTFYFTLFATIITGLIVPVYWKPPDLHGSMMLISVGLLSGTGQFFLTKAYGQAEVSAISPFIYAAIIWATLFGVLFWGHLPTRHTLIGTSIIILSGIYILHRERVRAVTRDKTIPVPEP
ncbi:MAG TPA: DMT family transporter [Acidobacteriota bacterium]|nr:DMT family transporter [Acidobacteriota bacterium]